MFTRQAYGTAPRMKSRPSGWHELQHAGLACLLVVGSAVVGLAEDTVEPDPGLDVEHFRSLATQWFQRLQPLLPHDRFEPAAARVYRSDGLFQPEIAVDYGTGLSFNFTEEGRLVFFFTAATMFIPGPATPSFSVDHAVEEATRILDSIRDLLRLKVDLGPAIARYDCIESDRGAHWVVYWKRKLRGFSFRGDSVSVTFHETRGLKSISVHGDSDECPTEVTFSLDKALARALTVAAGVVQRMPNRFSSHKVKDAKLKEILIVNPNYIFSPASAAPPKDHRKTRLAYEIVVALDDPEELPVTVWVDAITGEILGGTVKAG